MSLSQQQAERRTTRTAGAERAVICDRFSAAESKLLPAGKPQGESAKMAAGLIG